MADRKKLLVLCAFILLILYAFSFQLSRISIEQERQNYYVPSLQYLEFIGGTFKPLLADLLFIKGILELFEDVPDRADYFLTLFRTTVGLDERLINPYFLGGIVVPLNREEVYKGIEFLQEGMRKHPFDWRFPYWIGFCYLELKDYSKVIEYYQIASNVPHSPSFLKTTLAYYYYKAGKLDEGALYLSSLTDSVDDERILDILDKKTRWLKQMSFLKDKVNEYYLKNNSWPLSLQDLIDKQLIDKIPDDPFGREYYLDTGEPGKPPEVKSRLGG